MQNRSRLIQGKLKAGGLNNLELLIFVASKNWKAVFKKGIRKYKSQLFIALL